MLDVGASRLSGCSRFGESCEWFGHAIGSGPGLLE